MEREEKKKEGTMNVLLLLLLLCHSGVFQRQKEEINDQRVFW